MSPRARLAAAAVALAAAAAALPVSSALAAPTLFPSDALTVKDAGQITGKRLNLPLPDCTTRPSDCNDVRLLNQLDGFDLDPRVAVGFGGPIDVKRVTPDTLYLQAVAGGPKIGLNRLVWSPARNTLYGHPVTQLAESTRYRLVVTSALCGAGSSTTFTTMSATAGLAQMRRQLDDGSAYAAAGIPPAERGLDFVRPDGTRTVFQAANVARIRRYDDTGASALEESTVPNAAVDNAGEYAFGSFLSPTWLTGDRVIPQTPTKTGAPKVQGYETVGFTLIVPAGTKPADGWPVAIFGPGITRSKYDVFLAADRNAERGIATMAIDPVGHAFGPRSEASVDLAVPPSTVRFSGFGRGRDLNHNGIITNQEGVQAPVQPNPLASIGLRDGLRQTALDNMALVRAIARGVDVDGDGSVDLRRTGVVYYAQSLGGIYGTMLMGVDPDVRVGALNVPGGPIVDIARLSPGFRPLITQELKNRTPSLLNGGLEGFTESTPLYLDPPVTAPARGAVAIQDAFAGVNWLNRPGSPETFAPLLRARPLPDVGAKRVIYQFAYGDQTVPNPTSATVMRAGGLQDVTSFYRNDRTPTAGSNPHGFLLDPTLTGRNLGQAEVLDFLASDGRTITDPDGPAPVFEVPIADPKSLETANYSRDTATGAPAAETASGATGSCAAVGASACAARSGFVSASVRPRGHGLRFAFVRRVRGLATVDVFQSSAGRSLTGNRLVVRFTGRRRSFTWNGRAARHRTVRDGVLFARLRVRVAPGVTDVRRFTLRRRGGRYALARSFYRRTSCGLLTEFKLGAPVFGGRGARAARLAYRLSSPARVSVQVLRGTRVVRGFAARSRSAHHTYRLRVPAGRLARGAYRVRIVAHRGTRTVRATLFAQRL